MDLARLSERGGLMLHDGWLGGVLDLWPEAFMGDLERGLRDRDVLRVRDRHGNMSSAKLRHSFYKNRGESAYFPARNKTGFLSFRKPTEYLCRRMMMHRHWIKYSSPRSAIPRW